MTTRALLRSQITEAWHQSIAEDYAAQRINSERSLQASVWSRLNQLLPASTRRMFIEPCLVASSHKRQVRYPDLVVCNTREVIGIIELKYLPRGKPAWRKDLSTFEWINENRKSIHVSNVRFRGVSTDSRKYPLAVSILYVWAGVHVPCELELREHIEPSLRAHFLALHAETSHSEKPRLRLSWGASSNQRFKPTSLLPLRSGKAAA